MNTATVTMAVPSAKFSGLVLHLSDGERTILGAKQFASFVGGDVNSLRARHILKGASVSYTSVAIGDDIGNGNTATAEGHKIEMLVLSDRKSDLLCTLAESTGE
jgi:hypothetical protein